MMSKTEEFDLIIIGGGLAATFLCLSIYKHNQDFKILIIEKNEVFPQKIGESIVDLTAVFIQSLGVDHLFEGESKKTGVRFLFNEKNSSNIEEVAEFASPTYKGAIKGYHVDRSRIDQKLLDEVARKGVTVFRPGNIVDSSFQEFNNELSVDVSGVIRKVKSRWVVDATGRSRFIPKQLGWTDQSISLNTGAIMSHYDHVAACSIWDTKKNQHWETKSIGARKYSTTHIMQKHCWWWIIRLNETRTSIGVVFDKNKVRFHSPEDYFNEKIKQDPQLSLLTKGAEQGKIRHVENVPYVSQQLYSKGVALIGESGAFLDPFISPGLEMIGQQTIWLSKLLLEDKNSGVFNDKGWNKYSQYFFKSYESRLVIYEKAYQFMHSYDLFSLWLMQGNFIYFFKVVYPSVLFISRIKYPLSFNFVDKLGVRYFGNRLQQINLKREKNNRGSNVPKNTLKYSGVKVPTNYLLFPFIIIKLLFKSLISYITLEYKELKFKK